MAGIAKDHHGRTAICPGDGSDNIVGTVRDRNGNLHAEDIRFYDTSGNPQSVKTFYQTFISGGGTPNAVTAPNSTIPTQAVIFGDNGGDRTVTTDVGFTYNPGTDTLSVVNVTATTVNATTVNATNINSTNATITNLTVTNPISNPSNIVQSVTPVNAGEGKLVTTGGLIKKLVAGANITLTNNANDVTIASTGGGGGGATDVTSTTKVIPANYIPFGRDGAYDVDNSSGLTFNPGTSTLNVTNLTVANLGTVVQGEAAGAGQAVQVSGSSKVMAIGADANYFTITSGLTANTITPLPTVVTCSPVVLDPKFAVAATVAGSPTFAYNWTTNGSLTVTLPNNTASATLTWTVSLVNFSTVLNNYIIYGKVLSTSAGAGGALTIAGSAAGTTWPQVAPGANSTGPNSASAFVAAGPSVGDNSTTVVLTLSNTSGGSITIDVYNFVVTL